MLRIRLRNDYFSILLDLPTLNHPVMLETWFDEIRWYFEDFLPCEPFALERANCVTEDLEAYGRALARAIALALSGHCDAANASIRFQVVEDTFEVALVSKIFWELLENIDLWPESQRPCDVLVWRQTPPFSSANWLKDRISESTRGNPFKHLGLGRYAPRLPIASYVHKVSAVPIYRVSQSGWQENLKGPNFERPKRILILYARPRMEMDIEHRLATQAIFDVADELQNETEVPFKLETCVPGTLQALEAKLTDHCFGYYDVVHLDLHGCVEDER